MSTFRTPSFVRWAVFFLAGAATPNLSADVTARYKVDVTPNPSLAALMSGGELKGLAYDTIFRLKDGMGHAESAGQASITDFAKRELTVLDRARKRFATAGWQEYTDALLAALPPTLPEERAAIAGMKTAVEARKTGRTDTIQGILAEETQVVLSVEGPAVPEQPGGPMFRLVMQFWTSSPGESLRVAAVREFCGYNLYASAAMNPVAFLQKLSDQMPAAGGLIASLDKALPVDRLLLRVHADILMPGLAALLSRLPPDAPNPPGKDFDASAPLVQMNDELVEISSAPLDDSLFQIPSGYQAVPLSEIVRARVADRAGSGGGK